MVTVNLELPDWVEGKHLYVMAGVELVAYKYLDQPWKVKSSRCNSCGACCMGLGETIGYPETVDGKCIYLNRQKECSLGLNRPFGCCVAVRPKNRNTCTEEFK